MRKLTVLGSGDAFATGGKHTTSFLIEGGDASFLIDCGASTLVRLNQLNSSIASIRTVFITHFHGDHFGGLPFLFLYLKVVMEKPVPMTICGPEGLKEHVSALQEAMYPGAGVILDELPFTFIEYTGDWQQINEIEVKAYPVTHAPLSRPHGLKFRIGGKMFAFTGDTDWNDNLPKLAADTRLFITECNAYEDTVPGHLSLATLIDKKELLKSDRVVLTHMGREVLELKSCPFERLYDGMEINLW